MIALVLIGITEDFILEMSVKIIKVIKVIFELSIYLVSS